ncbi:MAG: GNAT family N-acetyltransferase [Actinomycetota bacterium]|jgi:ribosomal protein S18 acetylase RimI-like enzyme|nr:GNAT family N-acetyltransferase [Acidimicrobiales bacterium]MEC8976044.1 GNAT family N-acetyltransferase [Actinomycetota bacterium]MCS5683500.1 GNAT family N-acetyltransferase [Acidimicrobiales bacterium]MEC9270602.1 GNAT family N-acetyltransferase [Actinomycetota bacterium]MEC9315751.1 GNAT family N-acetyltransferase [Actinomycetota bacterium]
MTIEISVCDEVNDVVVAAFAALIPQLSTSSPAPTAKELKEIVAHEASTILLATEGETIVGSMTLVVFPIPTGTRAWIEDVVVREDAQGRGVGEALNRRAMQIAVDRGAQTINLTSRPTREAANRLYQRLGFVARETNIYRYEA